VIQAGVQLLEQQKHIYQGRLPELQQAAAVGLQAAQQGQGQVVGGTTAMSQIRENLRSRHTPSIPYRRLSSVRCHEVLSCNAQCYLLFSR
jgi:hypothetical protein